MTAHTEKSGRFRRVVWRIFITLVGVGLLCAALVLGINLFVNYAVGSNIVAPADAEMYNAEYIIVLGCQVRSDGTPSNMLRDRLLRAVELYSLGAAPKIIMSGDSETDAYDEVNTMRQFAIDAGVPADDILTDPYGLSTYESIYRVRRVFGAERIVVVTQKYHLYRALYIAQSFDMNAIGVAPNYQPYPGQFFRDVREVLARCKDFALSIYKPDAKYSE